MSFLEKLDSYAPTVLRVAIAAVFLYFGISQVSAPENWVSWLPDFVVKLSPVSDVTIIYLNGIFEIITGTMLALNYYRRIVATLLGLHLLHISLLMNFGPLMVRDLGLSMATLYLAMKKTP